MTLYDSEGEEVGENTWSVRGNGLPERNDFDGLKRNAYYYVCFHGIVEKDNISVDAQFKVTEVVPKPKRVTINSIKSTKKRITTRWKKVPNATKYQIAYRKVGAKKWVIKTTTKTSYTIKRLARGKKYQVKVRALRNASGKTYYGKYSTVRKKKVK